MTPWTHGLAPTHPCRSTRLHRLLRRGRSYGPARASRAPDGASGLYFICLAANLARQFEFVQHTWLNDPTFNGLYDDSDPLVGARQPRGQTFTVPARPVRRRYRGLPQFVRTRGGAYFFLPGISALRYLQRLPALSSFRTQNGVIAWPHAGHRPTTSPPSGGSTTAAPNSLTTRSAGTGCRYRWGW